MTNYIDPEIALRGLEKISIEIDFLYETWGNNTITNFTAGFPSKPMQSTQIPFGIDNLQEKIIKIHFGDTIIKTISISKLEELLKNIQYFIVNKCYKTSSIGLIVAYLKKIEFKIDATINKQVVSILVNNTEVLTNEGYHPDLIDYKVTVFQKNFVEEIYKNIIAPLQNWVINLIKSLEHSASIYESRKIIEEFTNVKPNNSVLKKLRGHTHYRLHKESKANYLSLLHEKLVLVKFISTDTKLEDFKSIFYSPVLRKIQWRGVGTLMWFIEELENQKVIHPVDKNLTAANIFEIQGKDVYKALNGGKKTKYSPKKMIIAEVLKKFKTLD